MSFGFMMRKHVPEEEMRRRMEFVPEVHHYPGEEMRRRMNYYADGETMRRTRSHDTDTWPQSEHLPMGYVHHREDEEDDLRAMLKDLHHKLDKAMESGYASTKQLAPNFEGVLEDAASLLEDCPKTWEPYLKHKDYLGIAKMEGKELLEALEAKKSFKDMRKELVHTIAALLQLAEM